MKLTFNTHFLPPHKKTALFAHVLRLAGLWDGLLAMDLQRKRVSLDMSWS
jgi:hypothetical protein